MGTPAFAVPALQSLMAAGHEVCCVYTQPPRPGGRGQRARPSAVQDFAIKKGLEVRTPRSLKQSADQQAFAEIGADAAVVAAYGLIQSMRLGLAGFDYPLVFIGALYKRGTEGD